MASSPIRVKLLSAEDLHGGAGIAAYRLLLGLEKIGVGAELFVQNRQSRHAAVIGPGSWPCRLLGKLYPYLDPVPKLVYVNRHRGAWSCGFLPNPCFPLHRLQDADVIHLHWVSGGLLPVQTVRRLQRPIVWTLHDAWPFTGGCHIPYECERYRQLCGECPQLRSHRQRDLSRRILEHKSRHWRDLDMTIIAPSRWMASQVASSALFRDRPIEVVPNGLDATVFSPLEKLEARRALGLPPDARLLLFSAFAGIANWNKGGDLLRDCLRLWCGQGCGQGTMLLLTGSCQAPPPAYFPIPHINYGVVTEDARKRLIYAAADVTAVPSRSENLPYVAMESMACGTPCVSFAVGGIPDIISHCDTGYLAEALSIEDFAFGLAWLFDDVPRRRVISANARRKIVAAYDEAEIARRHAAIYHQAARHRPE